MSIKHIELMYSIAEHVTSVAMTVATSAAFSATSITASITSSSVTLTDVITFMTSSSTYQSTSIMDLVDTVLMVTTSSKTVPPFTTRNEGACETNMNYFI